MKPKSWLLILTVAALGLALPEQAAGAYGSLDYGQLALMVLNSRIE